MRIPLQLASSDVGANMERSLRGKQSKHAPGNWTLSDLGDFYEAHQSEFLSHARRILRDSAKAEEIVQEVLLKFMLAAPELSSLEHAVAYLHRSIENQCRDYFRAEFRRPNLVLIDDVSAEIELLPQKMRQ
jgi:RNA polymerase sigma factor (sigma-70 family)